MMSYSILFWAMCYLWLVLMFVEYSFVRKPLRNVYPLLIMIVIFLSIIEQRLASSSVMTVVIMAALFPIIFLLAYRVRRIRYWISNDLLSSVWVMFIVLATTNVVNSLQDSFIDAIWLWYPLIAALYMVYCVFVQRRSTGCLMSGNGDD